MWDYKISYIENTERIWIEEKNKYMKGIKVKINYARKVIVQSRGKQTDIETNKMSISTYSLLITLNINAFTPK